MAYPTYQSVLARVAWVMRTITFPFTPTTASDAWLLNELETAYPSGPKTSPTLQTSVALQTTTGIWTT